MWTDLYRHHVWKCFCSTYRLALLLSMSLSLFHVHPVCPQPGPAARGLHRCPNTCTLKPFPPARRGGCCGTVTTLLPRCSCPPDLPASEQNQVFLQQNTKPPMLVNSKEQGPGGIPASQFWKELSLKPRLSLTGTTRWKQRGKQKAVARVLV